MKPDQPCLYAYNVADPTPGRSQASQGICRPAAISPTRRLLPPYLKISSRIFPYEAATLAPCTGKECLLCNITSASAHAAEAGSDANALREQTGAQSPAEPQMGADGRKSSSTCPRLGLRSSLSPEAHPLTIARPASHLPAFARPA